MCHGPEQVNATALSPFLGAPTLLTCSRTAGLEAVLLRPKALVFYVGQEARCPGGPRARPSISPHPFFSLWGHLTGH